MIEQLTEFGRVLLGVVFLTAGVGKLRDLNSFQSSIKAYRILPEELARPLSVMVVSTECGIGGLLLSRALPWVAASGALVLLLLFTYAIVIAISKGYEIDCGCFGKSDTRAVGWRDLVRNLLLIVVDSVVLGYYVQQT